MAYQFNNATLDAFSSNLVAAWKMDAASSPIVDVINSHDGTESSSPVYATTGKSNNAIQFDGSDDYFAISAHTDFDFGSGDFCIGGWYKFTDTSNTQVLQGYYKDNDNRWFFFWNSSNYLRFYAKISGSEYFIDGDSWTPTKNVWYLILCWRDGNTIYISVNNSGKGSDSFSQTIPAFDDEYSIGARKYSGAYGSHFEGVMDEQWVWKGTPLSSDARAALYNSGSGLFLSLYMQKRLVHDGLIDSKQKTLLIFDHTFESQIFDRRLQFDGLIDSKKKGLIQHDGIVRAQLDKRIAFDPSFSARHKKRIEQTGIVSAKVLKTTEHTGIIDAYIKSGYRVDAINVTTGAVTDLGFASAIGSPIEITGISLSPGKYDLRFWLQGYYWDEWLLGQTMRIVIEGSPGGIVEIESDLPPALQWGDPEYDQVYGRTVLHWVWAEQFGSTTPDDFLIWIQTSSSVDVGQTPDGIILADIPREYDFDYEQTVTNYVAICARSGDTRGHYITATIPYDLTAPDSPVNQFAHREDVL